MQNTEIIELELSPKDIASKLFNDEPKEQCHYGFFSSELNNSMNNSMDNSMIFEILITIMMEGLKIITNNFDNLDIDTDIEEQLLKLEPWFRSFGFHFDVIIDDLELYDDYYCNIILNNSKYKSFFLFKNIEENYHFLLNGDKLEENRMKTSLNELNALTISNNRRFIVSFSKIMTNI